MAATRRILPASGLLALLLLGWCAVYPYRLTDGDSCLYAAMGHEMAASGCWLNPGWAFAGARACFHENPPGAMWPAALLECVGVPDSAAPLLANAVWLLLLLACLARLPSGLPAGCGWLAPLFLLLLHEPLWRYVLRFGLEIPFAACAVATLAAARARSRAAPAAAGLALAAAFLARGVFALPLVLLLALDADPAHAFRRHLRRLVFALALAAALLLCFDLGHRLAAGHSFWAGYLDRQVLPSLRAGGTLHPNRGSTLLYYAGRLALYALPVWLLVALAWPRLRSVRAPRRDLRLALAWILLFFAGVAAARRQGSRYLFAVWPATALLAAHATAVLWPGRLARTAASLAPAALLLALLLAAGKSLIAERDAWWVTADRLRQERARVNGPIYGPFGEQDDRSKQFLRHHAGTWAFAAPPARPEPGSLRWTPGTAAGPRPPAVLLRTPLGVLSR